MDSILSLIGLAKKAGHARLGEEPVAAAARSRQAKVILLASDAADNTLRRATRFAEQCDAPRLGLPFTKAELGGLFGRSVCAVVAITDPGLASGIAQKVAERSPAWAGTAQSLEQRAKKDLQRRREQAAADAGGRKRRK